MLDFCLFSVSLLILVNVVQRSFSLYKEYLTTKHRQRLVNDLYKPITTLIFEYVVKYLCGNNPLMLSCLDRFRANQGENNGRQTEVTTPNLNLNLNGLLNSINAIVSPVRSLSVSRPRPNKRIENETSPDRPTTLSTTTTTDSATEGLNRLFGPEGLRTVFERMRRQEMVKQVLELDKNRRNPIFTEHTRQRFGEKSKVIEDLLVALVDKDYGKVFSTVYELAKALDESDLTSENVDSNVQNPSNENNQDTILV